MDIAKEVECRTLYTKGAEHEKAGRYQEAQQCYLQSAALGYGRSEFRLGMFFLQGRTGAIDKAQAFKYFQKAASHENRDQARACFNLALMLELGDGVTLDLKQACYWYEKAAALGIAEAKAKVAELKPKLAAIPASAVSPEFILPPPSMAVTTIAPAAVASTVKKIIASELELHEELGRGSFGIVYKATWKPSETVAVKQLQAQLTNLAEFTAETNTLATLAHPRIVRLFGVCLKPNSLVLEYMPKGTLSTLLKSKEQIPWPCAMQIGIDIAQGLSYLHQEHIIHRDLKSKNILLDEHNRAKLTNFGLSKVRQATAITTQTPISYAINVAPELFGLKPKFSEASDVYSYGTILWELLTRRVPYAGKTAQEIGNLIKAGLHEKIPSDCPPVYRQLIEGCWASQPQARPTAAQIIQELQQQLALAQTAMVKSWHCDPSLKPKTDTGEAYYLIDVPPGNCDVQKVVTCYQHRPVPYMDLKSVKVVYNLAFNRAFQARLVALQGRHNNPGFTPKWSQENGQAQRARVIQTLEQMAAPYQDSACPNVKIVAMWHGTKPAILGSIFRTGFANLASTDPGFYGKGIYSTWEAEYAHRVYSQGALLVNFVACFSAYPVIDGDLSKLAAGANYQNYDGHFIPVKPQDPHNPQEVNYYPCAAHEQATYHELVVFESAQCLPRYLVELQPSLPQMPVAAKPEEHKGKKPKAGFKPT